HLFERCAGEENFVHALPLHDRSVVTGNRSAATPEDLDIGRAAFPQKIDNLRKKFDVPAVVTRNANRTRVLLHGRADDIADRSMVSKINHFNPVPDQFEIDRVDGAVMPIANWDSGKNADR